ncbi:MAG: HAMP domain-containing protein, partial [Ignavibacteriae bacterium]|nr:HAMP domain-containing protein [Ignavibacteriota bacterium]
MKKETEVQNHKIIFILLFIFFLFLYLLSLRGFGAAIRSFVFDTSIRYFQNPSLNFTSEHLLMHINVLLMGLISILGSASFIIILFKQYQSTFKKNNAIFFIASLIVFLISIFIFSQIQKQPQSTIFIKSIHIILVFALVYIVAFYDSKFITKAIIFYFTASFISIITLLFYNSELEKESLKTTANVITRANDNLYKSLITETLLDDFSMRIGVEAFENPNANFNSYAFMIWSKSNLQKESMNSSVNFIDLNGNLLGGFGSIYPKININKIVDTNNVIEEIQIFEENLENDSQKLLRGIFPVKDDFSFLGYLDVSILSDINDFGFNSHPEFISSGKLNEKAILKLDKLAILDYRNKELKIVYGDLNPSKEMNATILNTQLTEKNDAWLDTDFNDSEYIIYIKKVHLNNFERIVAVALRDKDLSIGLFDFFKVFFTHVIVLLILIIFYLLIFYRREKKYQLDLRTLLLWAFLIISLIPLLLIAYFFRDITDSKNEEATYYKLGKRAFSIESYLADHFTNGENKLQTYFDASNDLNINFTIYSQNNIEYSSDDLIYDVGLIPKILNPRVYKKLVLDGNQEIMINEKIDDFEYSSFYYKSSMFSTPIIIKVSEGFNKILMPLSGSEVDVFLFGTYSLAAIFIILFSALLANRISSPIRKLTYATKSVAAGDLSLDLDTNAKGEIKELVNGFQFMIKELKRNQTILAEIEREEAWKEMAKQVAHEIKNPLTPMKLSVQQLITAYDDKSDKFDSFFKKVTATMLNQIETLKNIATEFSNFARMPKLKVEQLNLNEIISQSINLFTDEKVLIEI